MRFALTPLNPAPDMEAMLLGSLDGGEPTFGPISTPDVAQNADSNLIATPHKQTALVDFFFLSVN